MKKQNIQANYSENLDILSVDNQDRDYDRSIRSGDFIIDLDPKDKVRGVEIQNFSDITGLEQDKITEISEAEVEMTREKDRITIAVRLHIREQKTTLAAQIDPNLQKA